MDATSFIYEVPQERKQFIETFVRYRNDHAYTNTLHPSNSFEVPENLEVIKRAAHYSPVLNLPSKGAPVDHVQSWVYRTLTFERLGMFKNHPFTKSHPAVIQSILSRTGL